MLDSDEFYREFSLRNKGIIDARTQRAISTAAVLVAGCGSTGGAAVEPLVRLGVQRLRLADNGTFELNNLNRQHAGFADLGRSKAAVAGERVLAVNPHAEVELATDGVHAGNVEQLVDGCDLIVDGVDVTEPSGWRAKLLLHQRAATTGTPVISGYDMAGTQYVRFYDYRISGTRPLHGRITEQALRTAGPWQLLIRVVPLRVVPLEMIQEIRPNLGNADYSVPQLIYTSQLFGAVTARMAAVVLAGGAPRPEVVLDVHSAVRGTAQRVRVKVTRVLELARATSLVLRLLRGKSVPGQAPQKPGPA